MSEFHSLIESPNGATYVEVTGLRMSLTESNKGLRGVPAYQGRVNEVVDPNASKGGMEDGTGS